MKRFLPVFWITCYGIALVALLIGLELWNGPTEPLARIEWQRGLRRSSAWATVRAEHLRANPECAACGGRTHLAVHHKVPFHVDPARELDPDNLITLCDHPARKCHFAIGHLWSWERWNPDVDRVAADLRKLRAEAQRRVE
ncbi:MAG TPA: HNH endonuclease [Aquabacterium sp.]|nr:HNH endonuclease [Aquabacterium sp.]